MVFLNMVFLNLEPKDIKCDCCGQFVSAKQLSLEGGGSLSFCPDTAFTCEEILYRCKRCTDNIGSVSLEIYG